jgi:hypothetical protein
MQNTISRRSMVGGGVAAALLAPMLRLRAAGAPLTPLDPKEQAAAALGYVTDTATVDNKTNPNHTADQKCLNCVQFRGTAADSAAGCSIFAGKSVAATGWCKLWASTETATPD